MVGDLAQVHIQRNKVIEAILFRVTGAAELCVVLGDVALVQFLLCRKHVNALSDACLGWEFGKDVFLHAAKNEGLQNLSCILENRVGLLGGCDFFRGLLQFVGVRGVEEGEEGEELGKVVLNGSAGEEELVGRFDLAESLWVMGGCGVYEISFGRVILDAVSLVENHQTVAEAVDELAVAVQRVALEHAVSTLKQGVEHYVVSRRVKGASFHCFCCAFLSSADPA